MNTAQFLIALDVGTTFIKGALFQSESIESQRLESSVIVPVMDLEHTLEQVIAQLAQKARELDAKAEFDLVLIGHPPDVDIYSRAKNVSRMSHEESLSEVVKRLSSTGSVLAVDIGSRRSMVALGKYGKTMSESFEFGVGVESWNFIRQHQDIGSIRQWLTVNASEEELEDYLANKSLYPHIVPVSTTEIAIEQALAKLILQKMATELTLPWADIDTVILSGSVLALPRVAAQSLAIFLDGLQPYGSLHVLLDGLGILFSCGGAFDHWQSQDYRVGRAVLHETLTPLGTVVSFAPESNSGKKLAKVRLDTGLDEEQLVQIKSGEIITIPMPIEEDGSISMKSQSRKSQKIVEDVISLQGGEVGLILDGRSRPITLAEHDKERRIQLAQWEKQLNVHERVGVFGGQP